MSTINFSTPFTADKIDDVNGVIRGVSVITTGDARGHGLEVDGVTIDQMLKCATDKGGQIGVKVDHKSGAGNIVGFLSNFRREARKLSADFFLLEAHPQRDQILETARRMPRGVGLSASFVSPERGEVGKARCTELISVDWVTLPAANPDGLFSARRDAEHERPISGVERVRRVIGAASRGAEVGAVGGLAARLLFRRRGISSDASATTGAAVGALAAGAVQWRRDSRNPRRDLAARVQTILFQQRAAIGRVLDATRENVSLPVPGADEARTVARLAKKPLARRIGARALKVGAGAGLGYVVGRRYGGKAGAITGAVSGLLFSNPDVRRTVRLSIANAKNVSTL